MSERAVEKVSKAKKKFIPETNEKFYKDEILEKSIGNSILEDGKLMTDRRQENSCYVCGRTSLIQPSIN